jgi:hypothetical protein
MDGMLTACGGTWNTTLVRNLISVVIAACDLQSSDQHELTGQPFLGLSDMALCL